MVVLRGDGKTLGVDTRNTRDKLQSDTALGDWYVHGFSIAGMDFWLLLSSSSFLSVVVPAHDRDWIPHNLRALVAGRLLRLGVELSLIGSELAAMRSVQVAAVADEATAGRAAEFATIAANELPGAQPSKSELCACEDRLAEIECATAATPATVFRPRRKALQLIEDRWAVRDSVMLQNIDRYRSSQRRGGRQAPNPASPARMIRQLSGN